MGTNIIIIRVIAIDLPGYGRTGGGLDGQRRGEYLGSVISSLSPDSRPVLVSPSMSGSFVVPMLKQVGVVEGWLVKLILTVNFPGPRAGVGLGACGSRLYQRRPRLLPLTRYSHHDRLRRAGHGAGSSLQ